MLPREKGAFASGVGLPTRMLRRKGMENGPGNIGLWMCRGRSQAHPRPSKMLQKLQERELAFAQPAIGFLCAVSALLLACCPSLEPYQPCSACIAQNLPAAIGSEEPAPDLRLLSSHLNDPIRPQRWMRSCYVDYRNRTPTMYQCAVATCRPIGFGKSKSLSELATHRYVVLFDWSAKDQHIINLQTAIHTRVLKWEKNDRYLLLFCSFVKEISFCRYQFWRKAWLTGFC